ncbi:GDSL esterase/lipase [Acorus calamus]|uniref:GDSL esterase/lipase n=1 Tax=Acorus calamus TaxID=4465 RepID=A0AAV9EYA9_ACOCL|nr:GDSL esterase/lipase [Acorus calamus]
MEHLTPAAAAASLLIISALVHGLLMGHVAEAQLVPATIIFGDSVVDVGNNNNLYTIMKANFPPYGRDFVNHLPTGRFCNGKLATDFTVENLGFSSYPPAYLSPQATGRNLLIGANFASAASGYDDRTAQEYQAKVVRIVGRDKAASIFSGAIYFMSFGSSDFVQNYYINPLINHAYTVDQYSDYLIQCFTSSVQNLYKLGARRIGVTSLPPLGCLPASITLFGEGSNDCVKRLNNDATSFNKKLNSTSQNLKRSLSGLKLVVFDIYNPLYNLIKNPADSGFFEGRKACCGMGTIETSLLCNPHSPGTCANATGYVFWDSVHPSEAANNLLAGDLLAQGIDLIS